MNFIVHAAFMRIKLMIPTTWRGDSRKKTQIESNGHDIQERKRVQ